MAMLFAINVQADNGALAHARQLNNIVIDGDLSDWPDDAASYPIQMNNNGDAQEASESFAAIFRTGYSSNENAVFVALEVIDDVHIVADEMEANDWSELDSAIAYVDFNHTTSGSGSVLYLATGNKRFLLSGESSWDEDVVNATLETADIAVSRSGDTTTYEWKFVSPDALKPNTVVGLDFLLSDYDVRGEETTDQLLSWGRGFGKSQSGGRTGDVLLMASDSRPGTLRGNIALAEPSDDMESETDLVRVRIRSTTDPQLWVQVRADALGQYQASLPAGTYEVTNVDRLVWIDDRPQVVAPSEPVRVALSADAETVVPAIALTSVASPVELPERGALFGFDPDDGAALNDAVMALMEYYDVPGVSLALVSDGEMIFHNTYGTQNAYSGEPVTDDTLFEAASITKPVFAFAVNRMAERGEIDLDRPLHTYLPFEDIAHDKRYEKITARHVLSHQSGFPNWRWQNPNGELDIKFYPGIQFGYSGEGFEYLGRVVAHITGEPLESVVRKETLAVMGFEDNTFFSDGPEVAAQASRGHFEGMAGPHDFPDEIGVAYSMYTEARTFSDFMLALLDKKGLSAEGYSKMLEPQVAVPLDPEDSPQWPGRYSLGFYLMNSPFGLAYGHGGNNGNFTCQFELYPEQDVGFVIFTNADSGSLLVNALREYLVSGNTEQTGD